MPSVPISARTLLGLGEVHRSLIRARCLGVAKLALGIRAKEAFVISGTVAGFASSTTGAIWTAGTIVNVQLDPLNFREPMFVLECHKHRSRNAGDICRFRLIPLGALVLGDAPG